MRCLGADGVPEQLLPMSGTARVGGADFLTARAETQTGEGGADCRHAGITRETSAR